MSVQVGTDLADVQDPALNRSLVQTHSTKGKRSRYGSVMLSGYRTTCGVRVFADDVPIHNATLTLASGRHTEPVPSRFQNRHPHAAD